MNAQPLTGRAAVVATLRAKLSVARLRAVHGETRAMREQQAQAARRYESELREMGEAV